MVDVTSGGYLFRPATSSNTASSSSVRSSASIFGARQEVNTSKQQSLICISRGQAYLVHCLWVITDAPSVTHSRETCRAAWSVTQLSRFSTLVCVSALCHMSEQHLWNRWCCFVSNRGRTVLVLYGIPSLGLCENIFWPWNACPK